MAVSVATDVVALSAHRTPADTDGQLTVSLRRLSTGLRIGTAADDAAGLSISEGLRSQIGDDPGRAQRPGRRRPRPYCGGRAGRDPRRPPAVAGPRGPVAAHRRPGRRGVRRHRDRGHRTRPGDRPDRRDHDLQRDPVARRQLRPGQIGAAAGDTLLVTIPPDGNALDLGGLVLSTGSTGGVLDLDAAIECASPVRGRLGAADNRLTHTIAGLGTTIENLTTARSRIRDADMAQETVRLSRQQVPSQAGAAMLGQADQSARAVLPLLS